MYHIIGSDQKEYGPVAAEQVRQWLKEGRLNAQSKVRPEGGAGWQPLSALPEFAGDCSSVPPAPPIQASGGPARTSGLAIASLVCGVLGMCGITALAGLVMGIVALTKINHSQGRLKGGGLAVAGICVSGLMMLFAIPILAAMLLPALAKAKDRAQTINCTNNAKMLGLAVRMYALDNKDKFPTATNWCDLILTDAGSPTTFQCPADSQTRCAFAFNRNLDGLADGDAPPDTVLLFESAAGWNGTGGPEAVGRHKHSRSTVTVVFADGSVLQVPRSQLDSSRWRP